MFTQKLDPMAAWHVTWFHIVDAERIVGKFRPADVAVRGLQRPRVQWWPLSRKRKAGCILDGDDDRILDEELDELDGNSGGDDVLGDDDGDSGGDDIRGEHDDGDSASTTTVIRRAPPPAAGGCDLRSQLTLSLG